MPSYFARLSRGQLDPAPALGNTVTVTVPKIMKMAAAFWDKSSLRKPHH